MTDRVNLTERDHIIGMRNITNIQAATPDVIDEALGWIERGYPNTAHKLLHELLTAIKDEATR